MSMPTPHDSRRSFLRSVIMAASAPLLPAAALAQDRGPANNPANMNCRSSEELHGDPHFGNALISFRKLGDAQFETKVNVELRFVGSKEAALSHIPGGTPLTAREVANICERMEERAVVTADSLKRAGLLI